MAERLVQSPHTSIDIVKGQGYHTTSVIGVKREHSRACETILTHSNEAILGSFNSRKIGFLPSQGKKLTASKICDVAVKEDDGLGTQIPPKRVPLMSAPSSSLNPLLSLSHPLYALPPELVKNFASLGIIHIYPWQSSCLLGRGLLTAEKNLVYTAPTGGGKSLVADVLMLKRVIHGVSKKAILVLPYVALVQEKVNWLRKIVVGVHKDEELHSEQESFTFKRRLDRSLRVVGFFGGSKTRAS